MLWTPGGVLELRRIHSAVVPKPSRGWYPFCLVHRWKPLKVAGAIGTAVVLVARLNDALLRPSATSDQLNAVSQDVATTKEAVARIEGLIARKGGDDFLAVLSDKYTLGWILIRAERVLHMAPRGIRTAPGIRVDTSPAAILSESDTRIVVRTPQILFTENNAVVGPDKLNVPRQIGFVGRYFELGTLANGYVEVLEADASGISCAIGLSPPGPR